MQFLWKSQLKKERGKFLVKDASASKRTNRKERLESNKKDKAQGYAGVYFLWTLFFGTVGYLVLFSPFLVLGEPTVTGLQNIQKEAFRGTLEEIVGQKYFGIFSRNRYFLLQPRSVEALLRERYPLLAQVSVQPIFPDGLTVSAFEREDILVWCTGEHCVHVLEDGSLQQMNGAYEEEGNRSKTVTLRDLSGTELASDERITEQELIVFPGAFRKGLQDLLAIEATTEMTLSSRFANELRVKTEEGWEIFFSTEVPVNTSLEALALFLEKEIKPERRKDLQYVDLRTENRIFYRYQEGKEDPDTAAASEVISPESTLKKESDKKKSKKE